MAPITKRAKGAWVIAHSLKLQKVDAQGQFSNIEAAGKFGRLLSVMSASDEVVLTRTKVVAVAKANGINPSLELESLLKKMQDSYLISRSAAGDVAVLGITHGSVLEHTADTFDGMTPEPDENAAIGLAERVSSEPVRSGQIVQDLSDTFQLKKTRTTDLLKAAEEIGFVDAEDLDPALGDKLYFNGNIFRVTNATKTYRVLQSLKPEEQRLVQEFDAGLTARGFATLDEAQRVLGAQLFEKLQAIALFDVNKVANSSDSVLYVTRPASFSKYGNPWEEDTLDYAKALVASLAYGMTRSSYGRGRIQLLTLLLNKLIRGEWLNENTAAGEDYKYLEMKRVVETKAGVNPGRYNLRLIKKEVGVVALEVLTRGAGSSESLLERLPGAAVNSYTGPEDNRTGVRKKKPIRVADRKIADMLDAIRTGGLK
jgi:hypothetical protein